MKVTIKDIAKLAQVSITTVSLVLNEKPSRISEDKKEEIRRIAKKYNYVPNMVAKSLVSRKSLTIGLILPDLENSFFASLAKSICDKAALFDYSIIIANSNDLFENDYNSLQRFLNFGVDGILICVANESYQHQLEIIKALEDTKLPFVMVDRTFFDYDCNKVYFDNVLGGYLQTKYAIEQGHRKIACLSTKSISENGFHRFLGYKKALEEAGLAYESTHVFDGDYHFQSGYDQAALIIKRKDITALVCANDLMAYGVIHYFQSNQIKHDLLIIGYDNLRLNSVLGLKIPSILQDVNKLGSDALDLLMKNMKDANNIEQIVLSPEFVENK